MKRPSFRQRSQPARPVPAPAEDSGGVVAGSPFTQQQILHLMKTEFARARRHGQASASMLLEVDGLDELRRRHGEAFRGQVLAALAETVDSRTRGADYLGLIASGRYLLVLPHTDRAAAEVVGERLRQRVGELAVEVDGGRQPLTLSVGIAACVDESALFFDTVLKQAETALEWAQDAGGDRICAFDKARFVGGAGAPAAPPGRDPAPDA